MPPPGTLQRRFHSSVKDGFGALDMQAYALWTSFKNRWGKACGEGKPSSWSVILFSALGFCVSYFSRHHDQ